LNITSSNTIKDVSNNALAATTKDIIKNAAVVSVMPRAENLIRFYKLNETTGDAIDETGNQDGVVYGGMGRDGSKYTGNGINAYVDAGVPTTPTSNISIAFRITTPADVEAFDMVMSNTLDGDMFIYFYIYLGKLTPRIGDVRLDFVVAANTTYEVVLTTGDAGVGKLYENKIEVDSGGVHNLTWSTQSLELFRRHPLKGEIYSNTSLDYVAIWDAQLTPSEVDLMPVGTV